MDIEPPTPKPPGQIRPLPAPTSSGRIPFTYAPTGLQGETAYWLWGDLSNANDARTPLVALHGGPGFTHHYILTIAHIYTDFSIPVLMYDQIGCGSSTLFPDKRGDEKFWTPELFMAELDNVLDHFGLREKGYDLLGQSWGAMLAGQFTLSQPRGLRKVVLEGGLHDMAAYLAAAEKYKAELPRKMQDDIERCEREGRMDAPEYKAAEEYYYTRHLCRSLPWAPELMDAFELVEKDSTVYFTMMGPNEFNCTGSLKTWSIRKDLYKITEKTVPGGILVMNGYYDSSVDEAMEGFFFDTKCRVKWIRYGLSSHLVMLEETEKFIADLGAFLTTE